MTNQQYPAGWFPDPLGRYDHRWFNGTTWTSDVSLDGQRFVDPLGTSPGPTGGSGPGAGAYGAAQPEDRTKNLRMWGWILAGASVIVPFLAIGLYDPTSPIRVRVLHSGTPLRIDGYWFESQPVSFFEEMAAVAGVRRGDVVCCGHTHLPEVREFGWKVIVNGGSAGYVAAYPAYLHLKSSVTT